MNNSIPMHLGSLIYGINEMRSIADALNTNAFDRILNNMEKAVDALSLAMGEEDSETAEKE